MSSRKPRSVWTLLERLGHRGEREQTIQHVFEAVGSLTIPSPGDGPLRGGDPALHDGGCAFDGDAFLVSVFEALGTGKTWPACGSAEWIRLREVALRRVVARLAREGLLDAIAVGRATDVKDGEHDACASDGTDARDTYAEGGKKIPAAKGDGSASDSADAKDSERDGETPAAEDEGSASEGVDTRDGEHGGVGSDTTDVREWNDEVPGVEVAGALLRRCGRNREGWSRCVRRDTPLSVILRWASGACPDAPSERLIELAGLLRGTAWVDEDGHVMGGAMLAAMEAELEADWRDEEWVAKVANEEQWVDVVAEFETAIEQLRSVFARLSLL